MNKLLVNQNQYGFVIFNSNKGVNQMKKYANTLTLIAVGIFISMTLVSCGPPDDVFQEIETWLRSW